MKEAIKNAIPDPAWDALRNAYDGLRRLPELPAAYGHPWRRQSPPSGSPTIASRM